MKKCERCARASRTCHRSRPESRALDFFLGESERDFEKALELSTGIYFEVLADDLEVTPGQSFNVTATVVNRSSKTIEIQQVLLESQWKHQFVEAYVQPMPPLEKLAINTSGPLAACRCPQMSL